MMRYTLLFSTIAILALVTRAGEPKHDDPASASSLPTLSIKGRMFGTWYTVDTISPPAAINLDRLSQSVDEVLQRIDREMSTYRDDSEISRFNVWRSTDWFPVSLEMVRVVNEALRISKLSGGAFDITVDPLVRLWGFGPERHSNVPSDAAIAETRVKVGYEFLQARADPPALRKTRADVSLDLGAIGKGYASDAVAERLEELGISNYVVAMGGELHAKGHNKDGKAWRTGIERPVENSRELYCTIDLSDRCIATCGNYRNFRDSGGKHYCHIIDPYTAKPVEHDLASVTVICPSAMEADATGTALMVLGPDAGPELARKLKLPALFLRREGERIFETATPEFAKLRVDQ